jgi:hypothetical protein
MRKSEKNLLIRALVAKLNKTLLDKGYIKTTPSELMRRAWQNFKPHPVDPFQKWFPEDVAKQLQYLKSPQDTFSSNYMLKQHSRANWVGCPPELREFTEKLFRQLKKDGIPMYVHTCYRSPDLQQTLFERRLSKTTNGAHQRSCAIDVVHAYHHWDAPKEFWLYVGMTGKRIAKRNGYKLIWGGDETSSLFQSDLRDPNDTFKWDPAHWELRDWRSRATVIHDGWQETVTPYNAVKGGDKVNLITGETTDTEFSKEVLNNAN